MRCALLSLLFCFSSHAYSAPVLQLVTPMQGGSVAKIILTDERCKVRSGTDLPKRATWTENNRTTEGCWGVGGRAIFMFWEADQTILVLPVEAFGPPDSV